MRLKSLDGKGKGCSAAEFNPANVRSAKEFAELINDSWRKGADAFIEAGQLLADAKAELDRDQFDSLVRFKLAFDASTAKKLICIAHKQVLGAHVHRLAPCWSTLYDLSKLKDDVFEAAIADGRIHPGMQRKDAVALRKPSQTKQRSENPPQSSSKSSSFAAAWDAASREEIAAKLDEVGRDGLCEVLSEKLQSALRDAALGQNDQRAIANTNAEIASLARACNALLSHPEQHVDDVRKKLARIRKLAGDGKAHQTIIKSDVRLDTGALARGLGLAGPPGKKFPTMALTPDGVDEAGTPHFALAPRDKSFRH
jgi:hypothetical protein